MTKSAFAKIPPVQEIDNFLSDQGMKHGLAIRGQVRHALNRIREDGQWLSGEDVTRKDILLRIKALLLENPRELTPVINGSGTVIHTNLGRSVFSREVFDGAAELASSYSNLEFSLETGKRGMRLSNVGNLIKNLTGAEEVVIVNNNAAAILLSLISLAKDREVIISRGELVEIGGSFRIPEIIEVSGAVLKEVGTTNRTRIQDYRKAVSEQTAVLLKVHTSNYRITGFTESVSSAELAELAREENKIFMEDLGSGALTPFVHPVLNSEPLVPQVLKDGVDVLAFSGDKLLGGPQAGIIVGKEKCLKKIRKHPLYRALRCDKITMALLEKTILAYFGKEHNSLIPTQRMLNETQEEVKERAELILKGPDPEKFRGIPCRSVPGGGSLPEKFLPSWGIEISIPEWNENQLLDYLRRTDPPVIARITEGKALIDCRTVLPHQVAALRDVLHKLQTAVSPGLMG